MRGDGKTGVRFAAPRLEVSSRTDGSFILRSTEALETIAPQLGLFLRHWAEAAPDRPYLMQRGPDGDWHGVTFGEARTAADSLSQALLDRGLSVERPLCILSENSVNHGLLTLAALQVGIPLVPVSVAYSLVSQDHAKLRHVVETVRPGAIYVESGTQYAAALGALDLGSITIIHGRDAPPGVASQPIGALRTTEPTDAVEAAFAGVGPDNLAKILFTSGSTGMPKGVINTQRMLCASQQAYRQIFPFFGDRPPVALDWLPWNHTFGGNNNFNMILCNGGTLYIDEGRPLPGAFDATLRSLREIEHTIFWNVPRALDMLVPHLEADEALRRTFFKELDMIQYAAAALPEHLWHKLERLSRETRGVPVAITAGWGLTETAPMHTAVHWPMDRPGLIGLPVPGSEVKLVPVESKFEIRVKGLNVTPGYYEMPEFTSEAHDEEGYLRTGDLVTFVDPDDPMKGLMFGGRLAENFKLTSGTWVSVGEIRVAVIAACAPIVQDAVIAGHDRNEIGLLIFPDVAALRRLSGNTHEEMPVEELVKRREVRLALMRALVDYNRANPGGSRSIGRALLMTEPPSVDANEITDKGYLNQRACLERRHDLVAHLYAEPCPPDVLLMSLTP